MKNKKSALLTVAVAGLMAGVVAPQAFAGDDHHAAPVADAAHKDSCKGKDACKGKDGCKGKDDHKGHDHDKGDKNHCADKNHCKAEDKKGDKH